MAFVPDIGHDPLQVPAIRDTRLNRWLGSHLFEARDTVFLHLTIKVLLILPPLIGLLYWKFSWPLALAFWAVQLGWLSPSVILMLHNTMHRPFFKQRKWLTRAHAYVMSALFGIPTGYMEHHVGMHHVENNLPPDLSSTMKYQRDNFFHFLRYFTRFMLFGVIEVTGYLYKKRRHALMRRALISTVTHWALMAVGLYFAFWPTLVVFVVPWFTIHFLMMWGNWGQHAFIDATQPGNSYVNSITCINSGYNARAWNDGYHIGHHVKASRHWSEMPQDFLDNADRYAKEGAIVFTGVDFFIVSLLLFTRQYRMLAKRFIRLDGQPRSDDEVIAFLKSRTRRIESETPASEALPA